MKIHISSRANIVISLLVCSFIVGCSEKSVTSSTETNENLSDQLVMSVLWYQTSAEMVASYLQAYRYAELMLDAKLDTMSLQKPAAVVLDIDETVLDNSPYEVYLIENDELYNANSWKKWVEQVRAEALPGALAFTKFAKSRGVQVFYISNRREDELQATVENLEKHDFPNANSRFVFLRSESSDKTERRERVTAAYEVLVYIGDNLTDFDEVYADRENYGREVVLENQQTLLNNFVILPNPMYGEWEKALYDNNYGLTPDQKLQKRLKGLEN